MPGRSKDYLVFHRFHSGYPHSALIQGDMKVIRFWKTGKVELYDLRADPEERHDLAAEKPGHSRKLAARLSDYLRAVNPAIMAQYE